MSYGTNNQKKDIGIDLNTAVIWEVGIIFVIILVVMTVYLYGLYLRVDNAETARKLYTPRLADVANTKLTQQSEISRYSWVDQDKGLVSIPIELAMAKTAALLSRQRTEETRVGLIILSDLSDLDETAESDGETTPGE